MERSISPLKPEDRLPHVFNTGSSLDNIKTIENPVQTWIFDPPYNIGFEYAAGVDDNMTERQYERFIEENCRLMFEKTKEGGSMFLIHFMIPTARLLPIIERSGWDVHQWITWFYPHNMGMSKQRFTHGSRAVLWFSKGKPKVNIKAVHGQYKNPNDKRIKKRMAEGHFPALMDWWDINLRKNVSKGHRGYANQLPYELVKRCILTTTDPEDIVGDCMAGSGTTLEVAKDFNRYVWLNDLNPAGVEMWEGLL
jgi:DNA modification methylase